MSPILQTAIRYRKNNLGKKGVPGKATASFNQTYLQFTSGNKGNSDIVQISDIAGGALAKDVIVLRMKNGETRSLFFKSVVQHVGSSGVLVAAAVGSLIGYQLLSVLGVGIVAAVLAGVEGLMTMNAGKHRASAYIWLDQLRSHGITMIEPKKGRPKSLQTPHI